MFFYATLGVHTEVPHFETSNLLHLRCYHCPMAFLWAALEAEQHRRTPHSQINSVVQSCLCLRRREMRSEEHTSELQSLMRISYAVFCLKQKTKEKSAKHKYRFKIQNSKNDNH